MRAGIAPKLGAVTNMHNASFGRSEHFVIYFSSVSSIAGLSSHANYSAANATVDAYAQGTAAAGHRNLAVQWGAWAAVGESSVNAGPQSICTVRQLCAQMQAW